MRCAHLCLAVTSLLPAVTPGQSITNLPVGAHLRITASSQQLQDAPVRLFDVHADTLVVRVDTVEPTTRTLVLGEIERLDIEQGRDRLLGARIGDLLGAFVGGGIGYVIGAKREQPGTQYIVPPSYETTITGIAVGGISGAILGWVMAPPRWVEVPLPGRSR